MHNLIISAIGSDRPGIVSKLAGIITNHGGNIEKSRMTRLGSDFVIIVGPFSWGSFGHNMHTKVLKKGI